MRLYRDHLQEYRAGQSAYQSQWAAVAKSDANKKRLGDLASAYSLVS